MGWAEQASCMLAPQGSAPRGPQTISGTGTTAAGHTTGMTPGAMATLMVGAVAIRVVFTSANSGGVAATDLIIPAYGRFDWQVESGSAFVRVEAADQASAFEAWVWQSSPAV